MYINYKLLKKSNISDSDYHILMKIHMRFLEDLSEDSCNKLIDKGLLSTVKIGKTFFDKLRLTDTSKKILQQVHTYPLDEDITNLIDELESLFISYGVETGNKNSVLDNLLWFKSKTKSIYSNEEIIEALKEWLSLGYKMWLENILWDKKKSNIFTSIKTRRVAQSPLYEFMRRKYHLKW